MVGGRTRSVLRAYGNGDGLAERRQGMAHVQDFEVYAAFDLGLQRRRVFVCPGASGP